MKTILMTIPSSGVEINRAVHMLVCHECGHAFTVTDFAHFANLCDHVYLDALAANGESSLTSGGSDTNPSLTCSEATTKC